MYPNQNIKNELINTEKKEKTIEYFYIPPEKLLLLSIITMGLYDLYWFYKNWEIVKKEEKSDISPFWRAVFAIFFCYDLFRRILEDAKSKGYDSGYSASALATLYIAVLVVSNVVAEFPEIIINQLSIDLVMFDILWFIFSLLSVISLFIVQKAADYHNKKINEGKGEIKEKKYTGVEMTIIIIGVIFTAFFLLGLLFPAEPMEEERNGYFYSNEGENV